MDSFYNQQKSRTISFVSVLRFLHFEARTFFSASVVREAFLPAPARTSTNFSASAKRAVWQLGHRLTAHFAKPSWTRFGLGLEWNCFILHTPKPAARHGGDQVLISLLSRFAWISTRLSRSDLVKLGGGGALSRLHRNLNFLSYSDPFSTQGSKKWSVAHANRKGGDLCLDWPSFFTIGLK